MRNLKPAIDLIKKWEGLRLKAYKDPVNIPTIGYGTIQYPDGSPVLMGDTCTEIEATEWLSHEVKKKSSGIDKYVKVKINDNQYGALVSFSYNVGLGAFRKSTLLKKLNSGDISGAANEFKRWNKAGGKVLKGLINRRIDEKALFLKLDDSDSTIADDHIDEPSTPGWFEPFKKIIEKIIDVLFGENKDKPKTVTLSKGNGPRISREEVVEILKKKGADTSEICLLGIRGYYLDSMGVKGKNDRGIWDDAHIWCFPDGFMTFRANTDPSKYRKGKGTGAGKGMAMLKVGHWKYKMGMHKAGKPGGHAAFRQADKVTVVRDGNPDYEDTGWFGINIHRGGYNSTSSAGCQTHPRGTWGAFKELGYSQLKARGQKTFSYVLIDEEERR